MAEVGKSMRIVSNQIHDSMLERGLEKQTMKYCMDHDMAVLACRPLESGLLTGIPKPETVFPEGDFRRNNMEFSAVNIRKTREFVRLLKPLAEDKNISIIQLVLRWTIQRPGITGVLAGAMNAARAGEYAFQTGKWAISTASSRLPNDAKGWSPLGHAISPFMQRQIFMPSGKTAYRKNCRQPYQDIALPVCPYHHDQKENRFSRQPDPLVPCPDHCLNQIAPPPVFPSFPFPPFLDAAQKPVSHISETGNGFSTYPDVHFPTHRMFFRNLTVVRQVKPNPISHAPVQIPESPPPATE